MSPPPEVPSALVIGSGALACLFAARLSAAGITVIMLGSWTEGVEALKEHGVRLQEPDGLEMSFPVRVTTDPADCAGARYALVLVKSWQTFHAAGQLAASLAPEGLALTLQNGLGNYEILADALGAQRTALGVTTSGANLIGPGVVRAAGQGPVTLTEHPRIPKLAELLRAAGFQVDTVADPSALVWGKLVINAAINPLTALLGVPNGELLHRPSARQLMSAAASEAAAVAHAQGICLPYSDPGAAAEDVARQTAANRSSMLQDVSRGAPTEIDAISGAVARAGQAHGVPTPVNHTLWLLIKARVDHTATG